MLKEGIQAIASWFNPAPAETYTDGSGDTVVIVNEHQRLEIIDNDVVPAYVSDTSNHSTLESFVAYLAKYGNKDTFVRHCIGDKEAFQVQSIIDYHQSGAEPNRCTHKSNLRIVPTIEYGEVTVGISNEMSQRTAVQYLERIQNLVQQPTDDPGAPTAADIGALLRNLAVTANKSASVKTDTDGNVQNLKFESNNAPTVEIPEYFVVACKVFEELDFVGIKIKPSVKVSDEGRVTVTFRAPALKVVWRDANDALKAMLREQLDATIKVRVYE